jgi:hypothetical protein
VYMCQTFNATENATKSGLSHIDHVGIAAKQRLVHGEPGECSDWTRQDYSTRRSGSEEYETDSY